MPAYASSPYLHLPLGVRLIGDIRYREGASKAWTLDLALPVSDSARPRPALVFVHGGGWRGGDKLQGFTELALEYARKGYVAIAPNYRLSGEAPFPAAVEDVKCAVRWLRAHAQEYNVDRNRIGGYGNSAGAHLVAVLGLVGREAGLEGDGPYQDQSSLLQAVVPSAVPTDFTSWNEEFNSWETAVLPFLAGPKKTFMKRARQASPITYVRGNAPRFLVIHGTADRTVPFDQAERFVAALKQAAARDVVFLSYDGAGHGVFREHRDETEPINYRLRPETPLWESIRDGARAVQFLRYKAAEWNIDLARVAAFGGSAGAGMSLWTAYHDDLANPNSDDPVERQSSRLTCVSSWAGQASYDPKFWTELLGPQPGVEKGPPAAAQLWITSKPYKLTPVEMQAKYDEVAAIKLVTPDDPPAFLCSFYPQGPPTDRASYVHHPKHHDALAAKLRAAGVRFVKRHESDYRRKGLVHEDAARRELLDFFLEQFGMPPRNYLGRAARADTLEKAH